MATLSEIYHLLKDDTPLREASKAACMVAAQGIVDEADTVPNHANRVILAKALMLDPHEATKPIWKNVITKAAVLGIENPTDAQIQSTVDGLIDFYADGS